MELRIIQQSNLAPNRPLLEAFKANTYLPAFPDPNEREAFEAIVLIGGAWFGWVKYRGE